MEHKPEDFKKARILRPNQYENQVTFKSNKNKIERLKNIDIENRIEEANKMVNYNVIRQVGLKLKDSKIETLTLETLYELLRKATNVHSYDRLKHYAKILKQEGYIKYGSDGLWHVVKEDD